jgi:hypothetical protein
MYKYAHIILSPYAPYTGENPQRLGRIFKDFLGKRGHLLILPALHEVSCLSHNENWPGLM